MPSPPPTASPIRNTISDAALLVVLEPVGGDERAHRDDCADREVDLPGDDDQRLAERHDADQRRRERHLLEIGGLQKARLAQASRRRR